MSVNESIALRIAQSEGGECHEVPGDPGGLTSAGGITLKYYMRRHPDMSAAKAEMHIREMTLESAAGIIEEDFVDQFSVLHPVLRGPVASAAVNMGTRRAVRILQSALNVDGARLRVDGARLAVDGIFGPKTAEAARGADPKHLARGFCIGWRLAYERICRRNPEMEKFKRGWMNRIKPWYREACE